MIKRKLQNLDSKYFFYIPVDFIKILGWKKGDIIDIDIDVKKKTLNLKRVKK